MFMWNIPFIDKARTVLDSAVSSSLSIRFPAFSRMWNFHDWVLVKLLDLFLLCKQLQLNATSSKLNTFVWFRKHFRCAGNNSNRRFMFNLADLCSETWTMQCSVCLVVPAETGPEHQWKLPNSSRTQALQSLQQVGQSRPGAVSPACLCASCLWQASVCPTSSPNGVLLPSLWKLWHSSRLSRSLCHW